MMYIIFVCKFISHVSMLHYSYRKYEKLSYIMHTKSKKMWKALLVVYNAPKEKDTELYAYIFYVKYLINKVILVEFPLGGVK